MRGAADRVALLQAARPGGGGRAQAEILAHPGRALDLAGVRLGLQDPLVEVADLAADGVDRHRGQGAGQAPQPGGALVPQAHQRRHDTGAVHDRQALLGGQRQRRQIHRREGGPAGHDLIAKIDRRLSHQREGDVCQRREIAAGAHRPARRNHGHDVSGDQLLQVLQQDRAHPRQPPGQGGQPDHQDRPALLGRQRRIHPAAVVAGEVARQGGGERPRDDVAEGGAEAGVDPVGGGAAGHPLLHDAGAGGPPLQQGGVLAEAGRAAASRHGDHVSDGDRCLAQHHRVTFVHGCISGCISGKRRRFGRGSRRILQRRASTMRVCIQLIRRLSFRSRKWETPPRW